MSRGVRWTRAIVLHVLAGLCVLTSAYCISAAFFHAPSPAVIGMTAATTNIVALLLLVAVVAPRVHRLIGIRNRIGVVESWVSLRKEIILLSILPVIGNRFLLFATELIAHLATTEPEGVWFGDLMFVPLFLVTIALCYFRAAKAIMIMGRGTASGPGRHRPVVGLTLGGLLNTAFSLLALILMTLVGLPALMWQVLIASTLVNAMALLAALIVLRPVNAAKS